MATLSKINQVFPKALANPELVQRVSERLAKAGFNKTNTLVATSLCCDEVSRPLEHAFGSNHYGDHFSMGGLAGFPFGGVTSFGAMASHIPDQGHCLVVYGPHVGVDSAGVVGTVERIGRAHSGACCGSATAASRFVMDSHSKGAESPQLTVSAQEDVLDAQQSMVNTLLMPHAERLTKADDVQVELSYSLAETQREMMESIVRAGSGGVADPGMIAVLGGIQINTPPEMSDYFLAMQFDLYDNKGQKQDELLWED